MKFVRFKDTVKVYFIPCDEERGTDRKLLMKELRFKALISEVETLLKPILYLHIVSCSDGSKETGASVREHRKAPSSY